jgi:hypothetical protein
VDDILKSLEKHKKEGLNANEFREVMRKADERIKNEGNMQSSLDSYGL